MFRRPDELDGAEVALLEALGHNNRDMANLIATYGGALPIHWWGDNIVALAAVLHENPKLALSAIYIPHPQRPKEAAQALRLALHHGVNPKDICLWTLFRASGNAELLRIFLMAGAKSWRGFAMCALGARRQSLSVLINAGPTIDATLSRAAEAVWQEIAGHDQFIPLSRISQRVRLEISDNVLPWLTLFVDGTIPHDQALDLVQRHWKDWGIRVAVTVAPSAAASLEKQSRGRCAVVSVRDFTNGELQAYLESFLGDAWPTMPEFVRNPLRNPLIAGIYRSLASATSADEWSPHSEYEVFASFWSRLHQQEPLDALVLTRLAGKFVADGAYPWSDRDIADAGGDNCFIERLERIGWLRVNYSPNGVSFELPHARLINWACAHALVAQFKAGEIDKEIRWAWACRKKA